MAASCLYNTLNKAWRFLLLCTAIVIKPSLVLANPFFFDVERYSIKSGLPDSTVFSIARDQQGYLWLGTPNGLSRFNGIIFDNFSDRDPQGTEVATRNNSNIFIDSRQRIWVGTWGFGVYVYDNQLRLEHHFATTSEPSQRINSDMVQVFFEDSSGRVWIGTNGGGASMFDPVSQQITTFVHSASDKATISHNRVWHFAEETDGSIWLATGFGLDRIRVNNDVEVTRYNTILPRDSLLYQQRVRRLLVTPRGEFWVGTESGICEFTQSRERCEMVESFNTTNQTDTRVTSLVRGHNDQLWIGTLSGLYLFDVVKREFVPLVNGGRTALLPHDDIRDILFDENGVLWVASRPSGLIKISFIGESITGFKEFGHPDDVAQPIGRVHALLEDSKRNLWIGSTQGLLKMAPDDSRPKMVDPDIGLVIAMIEDKGGHLWVASNKGLFRRPLYSNSFEDMQSTFPSEQRYLVESLYQSTDGYIWIGTSHNGLFVFDGRTTQPVYLEEHVPQLPESAVSAIAEDQHNFVTIGVMGVGVVRFRLDSEKHLHYRAGGDGDLNSSNIVDITLDNDSTLWVATDNKLNELDDISNTFRYFPQDERLANLAVKRVLADKNNNIWFSTANGIYQLNVQRTALEHYTTKHGLHGAQFVMKSGFSGNDGDLYFGGISGFSRIRTSALSDTQVESKIMISHVTIDEDDILFSSNAEQSDYIYPHSVKDITFQFADLNLLSNINAEYSYRLLGHKDNWFEPSEQSRVSYSGLSPGDYEFQVMSVGKGISGENVASFAFTIERPWWLSVTALVSYVLVMVALFGAWSRWRLAALQASNELLEQEVKRRSEALINAETKLIESEKNASLTSLVVGVAHEINTPVGIAVTASSLIHDDSEALIRQFQQNSITRTHFERTLRSIVEGASLISTNLEKAGNLINSFKNLSTDQISQTKRAINLSNYLHEVMINLAPTLERAGVKWSIRCDKSLLVTTYPGAIAQLITQFALNAIEHAFDGIASPEVAIEVLTQGNTVQLQFSDNGIGVSDEMKEKVFKPFFTTRRQAGNIGLGLQIVANVVTIRLGGSIQILDNRPRGTLFVCEFAANIDEEAPR
ncbi:ligand-binding sensor domain-containing protein [Alteromonas facilis]|uniref:ligand-binding sensor domain-containing protein n=1 Tax=Alteromonas facilis TaxID=2048004 RepID=UPI000C2904C9|nr:two-component regulator propeller domain-containing protein [Alteromonas facilis]